MGAVSDPEFESLSITKIHTLYIPKANVVSRYAWSRRNWTPRSLQSLQTDPISNGKLRA
jgi:hypothetical protein